MKANAGHRSDEFWSASRSLGHYLGGRKHRPRVHNHANPRTLFGRDYAPAVVSWEEIRTMMKAETDAGVRFT